MKQLLFLVILSICLNGEAQISYTLTTFTSPYEPISGATVLSEPGWDDVDIFSSLGFPLDIGGSPFPTYIQAGDGAQLGLLSPNGGVAVFGITSDLIDGGIIPDAEPSIISAVSEGLVGNRIYKLQYQSAAFFNEVQGTVPSSAQRTNFQYWFYEVDNSIEIRFGSNSITEPEIIFDGDNGPTLIFLVELDGETDPEPEYFVQLSGAVDDPVLANLTSGGFAPALNSMPEDGRVYRFAPPAVVVGISERELADIKLYPNPMRDIIQVSGLKNLRSNAQIYDITGRQVWSGSIKNATSIDLSYLNSGVYIFSIEETKSSYRFLKQ